MPTRADSVRSSTHFEDSEPRNSESTVKPARSLSTVVANRRTGRARVTRVIRALILKAKSHSFSPTLELTEVVRLVKSRFENVNF